jgi:hypothetical protein
MRIINFSAVIILSESLTMNDGIAFVDFLLPLLIAWLLSLKAGVEFIIAS